MNPAVKRHRSPSYPAISLKVAVAFAEKLYPAARHSLGADVISQQMGYKGLPSAASNIAALKHFGLLIEEKSKTDRMLRLSELGMDIGVDPAGDSSQRAEAIKSAALMPSLYADLWEKWGASLPPDGEIRRHLERDRAFNPKAVAGCVADYKETLSFAGLTADDTMVNGNGGCSRCSDDEAQRDHGGSEGTKPPENSGGRRRMSPGTKEDVFSLDEGPVVLQWPDRIGVASAQDLEDWLKLIIRKAKRAADLGEQPEDEGE